MLVGELPALKLSPGECGNVIAAVIPPIAAAASPGSSFRLACEGSNIVPAGSLRRFFINGFGSISYG